MTSRVFELGRETQYALSHTDWKKRVRDEQTPSIDVMTGKTCLLPGHVKDMLPCLLATQETGPEVLERLLGLDEQDARRIAWNLVLLDLQSRHDKPCAVLRWDQTHLKGAQFEARVQVVVAYGFVSLTPPCYAALFAHIQHFHAADRLARELETAYEEAGVSDAQVEHLCAQSADSIRRQARERRAAIERDIHIRLDVPKP